MADSEAYRCEPGDITVTKIYTGYLVGRALAHGSGPGPWWHYVATVVSFEDACYLAHSLADAGGVRAWLHRRGDEYQPLPRPGEPEPDWTTFAGLVLMKWLT
jgi:hypothetical protein